MLGRTYLGVLLVTALDEVLGKRARLCDSRLDDGGAAMRELDDGAAAWAVGRQGRRQHAWESSAEPLRPRVAAFEERVGATESIGVVEEVAQGAGGHGDGTALVRGRIAA